LLESSHVLNVAHQVPKFTKFKLVWNVGPSADVEQLNKKGQNPASGKPGIYLLLIFIIPSIFNLKINDIPNK